MSQPDFETSIRECLSDLKSQVVSQKGDWTVKGFIDIYRRVYTISLDTKVLSKVLELLMFPVLVEHGRKLGYKIELARQQNQYPDLTFIRPDGVKYALDIKSTYRDGFDRQGHARVSGMTLGTFMGYFRDRKSKSKSTYPYEDYSKHLVLGVVYSQVPNIDERKVYTVNDLGIEPTSDGAEVVQVGSLLDIPSVAKDFDFFIQEKYKIAADYPGSGNTKNIGSTLFLNRIMNGKGTFAELGIEIFDDYWMNYRNLAMAKADGLKTQPYKNLIEYRAHIARGKPILDIPEHEIVSEEVELEAQGELPEAEGDNGDS